MGERREFLVLYDYGQGAVWAVITAEVEADIKARFPALEVVNKWPNWMDDKFYQLIKQASFSPIEGPYQGWLQLHSDGAS